MNRKNAAKAAVKQANAQRTAAVQQLRASGAAGKHKDKRDKRARTRQTKRDRAVSEFE